MKVIVFDKALFKSEAYSKIKSLATLRVLIEFYSRRQIHKPKDRRGKHSLPVIENNGKIQFTYEQAAKIGIPQSTFARSIKELSDLGFIKTESYGHCLFKKAAQYSITENWRLYGTSDFKPNERLIVKPPYKREKKKTITTSGKRKQVSITTHDTS
jgi:hypothetical protein